MQASPACYNLIRISEGLRFNPYQDGAGYWTCGYGHKFADGEALTPCTYQEAEAWLVMDVGTAEKGVNELTSDLTLTQGQFDALVDFVYNFGATRLAGSELLKLLRVGNTLGAANEFLRWVHVTVGGVLKVEDGLVTRRNAERSMFLSGMPLTA